MNITLKPETERLFQEELQSGHFHSVDEIIVQGVQARRENKTSPEARRLNTGNQRGTRAEAAEHIRQSRLGNRLPAGTTIRDLINEGRACALTPLDSARCGCAGATLCNSGTT